jgi:hypothetical protein
VECRHACLLRYPGMHKWFARLLHLGRTRAVPGGCIAAAVQLILLPGKPITRQGHISHVFGHVQPRFKNVLRGLFSRVIRISGIFERAHPRHFQITTYGGGLLFFVSCQSNPVLVLMRARKCTRQRRECAPILSVRKHTVLRVTWSSIVQR